MLLQPFRSDESVGSPSSSATGISNGSGSGIAERIGIRWDNLNNNNASTQFPNISTNNSSINIIQNGSASCSNPIFTQISASNNVGIYSGGSSLSGDNMSIGSITDIPGIIIIFLMTIDNQIV